MSLPIQFGTDGWRAIIGRDFTYDNVRQVIQAYCDLNANSSPPGSKFVILGYDRRFCSEEFAKEAAGVLAANGFAVHFSRHYCPTPCVSWMTSKKRALAGIVITASHNPHAWNGIKFKETYGGSASPAYTQKIEQKILENRESGKSARFLPFEDGVEKNLITFFDPQEYVRHLQTLVDIQKIGEANLKIACDPIHGAGAGFFKEVLQQNLLEIRSEQNPSFGGVNPEPIAKNLGALIQTVQKEKCAIGLATDGDADRIGAVDEKGDFVDSQQIFSLILRHLIQERKMHGDVVSTVSATQLISRLCKKHNLQFIETPIGFKHICQQFVESKKPLMGGEESGGIGFPHHVYERDGILSGLFLLEILATHRKPLSAIIADLQQEIGPLHFLRKDLHLPQDQIARIKQKLSQKLPSHFGSYSVVRTNLLDGFKFVFEQDSWLLIRPSGTEPLLRIYAEAPQADEARQLIQSAEEFVLNSRL